MVFGNKINAIKNIRNSNKSIEGKIEDYLDNAQEGKSFSVDVGIDDDNKRVTRSQKRIIALNKLTKDEFINEISNFSYNDKLKFYQIDKLIDTNFNIHYKENIKEGVLGGVLFLKNEILENLGSGIGKKPGIKGLNQKEIEELLDVYPNILNSFVEKVKNIKNINDINELRNLSISMFDSSVKKSKYNIIFNTKDNTFMNPYEFRKDKDKYTNEGFNMFNIERIIGKKSIESLMGDFFMVTKERKEKYHNYIFNKYNKITQDEIDEKYESYINIFKSQLEKQGKNPENYKNEVNFLLKEQFCKNKGIYEKENDYSFIKEENNINNINGSNEKLVNEVNDVEKKERMLIKQILNYGFSNIESKLSKEYTRIGSSNELRKNGFSNIHEIKDILFDKYGINKMNFGNTISDTIAKEKIIQTLESFDDMKEILGLDIKKINSMHGLGLGFAVASGLGRKSMGLAHYNSSEKFINFTKEGLNGNFGHEYFHFLDNFLFHIHGFENAMSKKGEYLDSFSQLITNEKTKDFIVDYTKCFQSNLFVLFRNIINFILEGEKNKNGVKIKYLTNPKAKKRFVLTDKLYKTYKEEGLSITKMKEEFEKVMTSKFIYKEGFDRQNDINIEQQRLFMEDFMCYIFEDNKNEAKKFIETNGKDGIDPSLINNIEVNSNLHKYSDYYSNSLLLDNIYSSKKYYSKEVELFARTFENYLHFKIKEKGSKNNFLVEEDYDNRLDHVQGNEKDILIKMFDELFLEINNFVNKK